MNIPRPEHPNPQFERNNWMNLNGTWSFEIDNQNSGEAKEFYKPEAVFSKEITVPFCPESELSGVCIKDFILGVWYKKSVELLPLDYLGKKLILHFGACDFFTKVYVNGNCVGSHKGGYTPFSFDITKFLSDKLTTITVYARDDTRNSMQSIGKQSFTYNSQECIYTRTTGIWQTVWIEFIPESFIQSVKYYPNADNCSLDIQATVCGKGRIEATAYYNNKTVGVASAEASSGTVSLHLDLSEKHLWNVGEGKLYDLELRFCEDYVKSYFGLRSIRIDGKKFLINNKSVFQRLVLDQGFYKKGIYTAEKEEDFIKDIQISLDAGFNGARLHQKIFEPRFLYHCDKMGYIVWGEYPNCGLDHSYAQSLFTVLPEWLEAVNRDFNHPSIIGWCPFNETWDRNGRQQIDDIIFNVYSLTKHLDPTRPCIDTSGNFHVKTDIFDLHDYEDDVERFKQRYDNLMLNGVLEDKHSDRQQYNGEPVFVSEYGGIQWSLEPDENSWGYGNAPKSEEEFVARYKGLTDALLDNNQMLGFCYTQLYDVEQEQNGLYTYDREPKFDMNIFKEINSRKAAIED